ncbi:sugar 3,4-ketoisomerase [Photobacterium indicum]|uniref:dTDP-6-deoxy-3,4-keto-hexulose isomerase n=1 Tax=Photobacterium indicum TaxID=81447 RepID=A0A2T3L7X1_9GAMM|nr:FdtA/QdtA family cupin domain-containing protein [Photobacterium indicum]PSV46790.1 dTDP-6-deoxy-3,4-keto-hexulose isomerase [Photobacterium indicum]
MSLIKLIKLNPLGDDRGSLISLEEGINIPFEIKRVYYIFDTKSGVSRGYHAHKNLEQVVVCVKGSCRFILDDGDSKEEVTLNRPDVGLYIDNMTWREMHEFSEDCVLVVLASNIYDESDYIRDYQEFKGNKL